eukprot:CAMPEP_0114542184 /NCGR_PEP_ID=MMETSP0114-20121206/1705_1 /TAXON_ID=31324 /ORGANISM="Goniomonas sp, Strain m" /LENGTH=922 /DNA_ID=CAMNT_0001726475 /DNA_START=226 /DNA_END=2993 /DNA_ORIENTATION=-
MAEEHALGTIQRYGRGFIARSRVWYMRESIEETFLATVWTRIQALARGFVVRRQFKRLKLERKVSNQVQKQARRAAFAFFFEWRSRVELWTRLRATIRWVVMRWKNAPPNRGYTGPWNSLLVNVQRGKRKRRNEEVVKERWRTLPEKLTQRYWLRWIQFHSSTSPLLDKIIQHFQNVRDLETERYVGLSLYYWHRYYKAVRRVKEIYKQSMGVRCFKHWFKNARLTKNAKSGSSRCILVWAQFHAYRAFSAWADETVMRQWRRSLMVHACKQWQHSLPGKAFRKLSMRFKSAARYIFQMVSGNLLQVQFKIFHHNTVIAKKQRRQVEAMKLELMRCTMRKVIGGMARKGKTWYMQEAAAKCAQAAALRYHRRTLRVLSEWSMSARHWAFRKAVTNNSRAKFRLAYLTDSFSLWHGFLLEMRAHRAAQLRFAIMAALQSHTLDTWMVWAADMQRRGLYRKAEIDEAMRECLEREHVVVKEMIHSMTDPVTGATTHHAPGSPVLKKSRRVRSPPRSPPRTTRTPRSPQRARTPETPTTTYDDTTDDGSSFTRTASATELSASERGVTDLAQREHELFRKQMQMRQADSPSRQAPPTRGLSWSDVTDPSAHKPAKVAKKPFHAPQQQQQPQTAFSPSSAAMDRQAWASPMQFLSEEPLSQSAKPLPLPPQPSRAQHHQHQHQHQQQHAPDMSPSSPSPEPSPRSAHVGPTQILPKYLQPTHQAARRHKPSQVSAMAPASAGVGFGPSPVPGAARAARGKAGAPGGRGKKLGPQSRTLSAPSRYAHAPLDGTGPLWDRPASVMSSTEAQWQEEGSFAPPPWETTVDLNAGVGLAALMPTKSFDQVQDSLRMFADVTGVRGLPPLQQQQPRTRQVQQGQGRGRARRREAPDHDGGGASGGDVWTREELAWNVRAPGPLPTLKAWSGS